ncbi:MAG: tRNA pseudouridine(13) synthase TruD [Anaerolineae bacterium]|nr:tRNA pseudouridine(13) synthase TruD [Anaerolineae bacterium]
MSSETTAISLPYITPELPGVGGQLKADPSTFVVEEIAAYDASGEGSHLYVSLTREGWTTRRVADALAALYHIDRRAVGFAGLKDRHARCTQTFSLPNLQPEDARRIEEELPFTVNWARCHTNKLKTGHLLGNRFTITVAELSVDADTALTRADAIASAIAERGVPNFFGAQRFGVDGQNVARGRAAFLGDGPRDKWLNRLLISAYQSHLFNCYLAQRIGQELFDRLLDGDVCKKADTGGMFEVNDPAAEQPRFDRGEITYTGPLFGKKMWAAAREAGTLEQAILADAGLGDEELRRCRSDGSRRPARLWLPSIALTVELTGLQATFSLPKGAYATVVMREFIKSADAMIQLPEEED